MKKIITLLFLFFSTNSFALEMDEKLTLRILELSKSKKTVLVNRGLEDGLVVGDHAKFFLTTGVVARAMVVKASPSRTIWSVYRIINEKYLEKDRVMNLKIASPVKVTQDPSKALVEDSRVSSIPMAEGADDIPAEMKADLDKAEQSDLAALGGSMQDDSAPIEMGRSSKTWEVYGLLSMSSLSGTYDDGTNSDTAFDSSMDVTGGVEKYFTSGFWKNVSIAGFVNSRSAKSGQSTQSSLTFMDLGGSISYHFYNSPLSYGKPILFGSASFGQGSVESVTTTNGVEADPVTGTSTFTSFGGGAKFNLRNGFGARAHLDYYTSASTFEFDDGSGNQTLDLSGLRIRLGLSYRF